MDIEIPVEPAAVSPEGQEEPEGEYLSDRGFFSGDRLELTLTLQNMESGEVLWQNVVRDSSDPRDAGAVKRLLDQALASEGWAEGTPPAQPKPLKPLGEWAI